MCEAPKRGRRNRRRATCKAVATRKRTQTTRLRIPCVQHEGPPVIRSIGAANQGAYWVSPPTHCSSNTPSCCTGSRPREGSAAQSGVLTPHSRLQWLCWRFEMVKRCAGLTDAALAPANRGTSQVARSARTVQAPYEENVGMLGGTLAMKPRCQGGANRTPFSSSSSNTDFKAASGPGYVRGKRAGLTGSCRRRTNYGQAFAPPPLGCSQ